MYSHHSKNGTFQAAVPTDGFSTGDLELVRVDGWRLVKSKYPGITGVASYPFHIECETGVYRRVFTDRSGHVRPKVCIKCGDPVPEEINGLWTLHNWELETK